MNRFQSFKYFIQFLQLLENCTETLRKTVVFKKYDLKKILCLLLKIRDKSSYMSIAPITMKH